MKFSLLLLLGTSGIIWDGFRHLKFSAINQVNFITGSLFVSFADEAADKSDDSDIADTEDLTLRVNLIQSDLQPISRIFGKLFCAELGQARICCGAFRRWWLQRDEFRHSSSRTFVLV